MQRASTRWGWNRCPNELQLWRVWSSFFIGSSWFLYLPNRMLTFSFVLGTGINYVFEFIML